MKNIIMAVLLVIMTGLYIHKSVEYDHVYKLAYTDGLTELYNHRYFQEKLDENIEKAKSNKSNFSLILVDIDSFKNYNDKYGHQAGDAVIKQVANLLKDNVKKSDIVARYGGDEMAIILTSANYNQAVSIAEKICKSSENNSYFLPDNIKTKVSLSLGVSTYPAHAVIAKDLIELADQSLYYAKENGKNQVGIFPEQNIKAKAKAKVTNNIKEGS